MQWLPRRLLSADLLSGRRIRDAHNGSRLSRTELAGYFGQPRRVRLRNENNGTSQPPCYTRDWHRKRSARIAIGKDSLTAAWGLLPPYQKLPRASDMRVLLIEDDSATAQSIELMLKSESFDLYTTGRGGWSNVVGPFCNRKAARPAAQPPAHRGSVELVTFSATWRRNRRASNVNGRWRLRVMTPGS